MKPADAISRNLGFWQDVGRMVCNGLTPEQVHTIPPGHQNHMAFCLWHGVACADMLLHSLLIKQPPVYVRDGWAGRIPVPEGGRTPFGTGWTAEQVRAFRLDLDALFAYTESVKAALLAYAASLSEEEAAGEIDLPFFADLYPSVARLNRLEVLTFFGIAHLAEHLGEAQFIRGMLGVPSGGH